MAEKVTLWCLDESLRDYSRRLDGVEVRYLVGKRLALSFVDAERPAAGGGYRAAHRYTVTFSQGFRALQVLNLEGSAEIDGVICRWIDEGLVPPGHCPVFRLRDSDYLRWLEESNRCGSYGPMPGLTHYLFVTEDQIYEVLSGEEPEVTVEKL